MKSFKEFREQGVEVALTPEELVDLKVGDEIKLSQIWPALGDYKLVVTNNDIRTLWANQSFDCFTNDGKYIGKVSIRIYRIEGKVYALQIPPEVNSTY